MWRAALPRDDDTIAEMCLALYREDPSSEPGPPPNIHATLTALRSQPSRGRAVVLEAEGRVVAYALLIAFWSNELGGEVCDIDELYVVPELRSRGYGSSLFDAIERAVIWPERPVAMALVVNQDNTRARGLYERLGFKSTWISMVRRPA